VGSARGAAVAPKTSSTRAAARVDIRQGHGMAEIDQRGDAIAGSATPHGTIAEKCARSGSTLMAMP